MVWIISISGILLLVLIAYIVERAYSVRINREQLTQIVQRKSKKILRQKRELELLRKALEKEQKRISRLLESIFPKKVVQSIEKGKARMAEYYESVSVMYIDFKGFYKLTENLSPKMLVENLNYYFSEFDRIAEKYGVEKIKTIGDCYMCTTGVPEREPDHAVRIVLAAMEMRKFLIEANHPEHIKSLSARIGIDSGDCVSGVIGQDKLAFDIWGRTVNMAHEIQNASELNKINISERTHQFIHPFFNVQYRGREKTEKGGEVDMYYVNELKLGLSENGEGKKPSKLFWEQVKTRFEKGIRFREFEQHTLNFLAQELPENLYYHGVHHAISVAKAAEKIALEEGIVGEDLFCLKAAALLHDSGFVKSYKENEKIGAEIAGEILPNFGFNPENVDKVKRMIIATKMPHNPKTKLEKILCDADLFYLGEERFDEIADSLKKELRERRFVNSDLEWDEIQVKFLSEHRFHTNYAVKNALKPKLDKLGKLSKKVGRKPEEK